MPGSLKITKASLTSLVCPPDKSEAQFWDSTLPGFGVRAYKSGRRLWIAQYRDSTGRTRKATLGDLRIVQPDAAREAARQMLAKVELGEDPQAAKRAARQAVRVGALVESYLADAERRMRPRSFDETARHLRTHAKPLHPEAAARVGRADIVKVLAGVSDGSGPTTANRVRSSLSAMWTWALRSGEIDGANPVAQVPKPGVEQTRERVLSDAELALIWHTTNRDHDHDRIVRLLLLTGARREEVAGLAWTELDGPLWTLPRERSKNALPHEVPLGPLALAQMPDRRPDRDLVFGKGNGGFSGWSTCKDALDARVQAAAAKAWHQQHGREPRQDEAQVKSWRLHDLRRTVATWLHEHDVEPHVVEAVLNHVGGAARAGVAGVYNRAAYREQKRAALARWEAHVRQLAGLPAIEGGNVVALRAGA
jgi:integrase